MKYILFFTLLVSLGSCTDFEPAPIAKFDMVLDKLDPNFERIQLVDALQLKNKDIIVGGYVELKDGSTNALLVRLNNWGIVQETLQFDTQADETMTSMAIDGDENIYLAGARRDFNKTRHGLICKASTKNGLQFTWNKLYEWLPERLSYKIAGNSNQNLTIFRSAISGPQEFSGRSGSFSLDTAGTNKRCEKTFGYYDVLSSAIFQDKVIFAGVAFGLPDIPHKPGPAVITFWNARSCEMKHQINFNFTTQRDNEFNYIAALAIGPDHIYAMLNKVDTLKTTSISYFFNPYLVQLQLDTSLKIVNPDIAKVKLEVDTTQKQASCPSMVAGRNGSFTYAMNYISGESYHTVIENREATFPANKGWTPLSFTSVHTQKLISMANNKVLIICGNKTNGYNRLIRINSKGQIE